MYEAGKNSLETSIVNEDGRNSNLPTQFRPDLDYAHLIQISNSQNLKSLHGGSRNVRRHRSQRWYDRGRL